MSKRKEYIEFRNQLLIAKSEEEVIDLILKIVKNFNVDFYKNDMFENPYFKQLIPDIKQEVIVELNSLRKSFVDEITAINTELDKFKKTDSQFEKLKKLKRDCLLLIDEIDEKLKDLKFNLL